MIQRLRYSPPGRVVVDGMKATMRAGAMATAAHRVDFDFLIAGAKRGGTTSLWNYLRQHPGVHALTPEVANVKGTYFLADEWDRGLRWWRSHAPTAAAIARRERRLGHRVVVGEASPYYLAHPLAAERAAVHAPNALVVVSLRDPVERAWSHYKERLANDTEPLSFAEAINAEPARCAGEVERIIADPGYRSFAHRHQSYVGQGRYAPMLERWFTAMGRDRVLVLIAEELYADPQSAVRSVTRRLDLPDRPLVDARPHNAEPSPDLAADLRARLCELLADDIAATEDLLGVALPWSTGRRV